MRQIVLDTETTGLSTTQGHRIIEIGCIELETEPRFPEIVEEFLEFVADAELIIHNADFDVGFIEHELRLMEHAKPKVTDHCTVLDTLTLAREIHPGQRNSLDALCKRYEVDASKRDVHGALIDSELLARVYLAMTGGQSSLLLDDEHTDVGGRVAVDTANSVDTLAARRAPAGNGGYTLTVIEPSPDEVAAHDAMLEKIRKSGACVWDFD